ncbi:ras-specific guanine nucleotide-releasing factor RalGPS2 isoform X5 [Bombina bombina]|nr:ras-specific guanine nucleotide-releasing factor RalGPS2 isoform X5 [Bombina bombina]
MAVVSGLQSAPIFRLTKTWALLSRKDKTTFEKLEYVVSKEDNYKRLRDYINSLKMTPCIPYLGIYLSDLTYIDSAYPSTGSILENEQRSNLMNNILRIISDLQQSCEYDIPLLPHVQKYLNSVRYIEELQKFVEDDNYKLSLKIEPGTSTPRSAASREDLAGPEVGVSPQSSRKSIPVDGVLLPPTPPSPRNIVQHGHRKCHSLGYNFIHKMNSVEFKSATFPNAGPRHLLDDSVMEPHTPSRGHAESSTLSSGISIGSSDGSELSEDMSWPAFERNRLYHSLGPVTRGTWNGYRGQVKASRYDSLQVMRRSSPRGWQTSNNLRIALLKHSSSESTELALHLCPGAVTIQGVLRRKTLLKEGKKPTVASWTKYWAVLCGTQLIYYTAKCLKATDRKHFKSMSTKSVSVIGWMVMMADDPEHPDIFLLTDSEKGNSYKFQAGNRMNAMLWFKHLSNACQSNRQQAPANLMTFE